jgi:hypothetical protein
MVPNRAWAGRSGLEAAADVNAVPPLGIEGVEVTDNGKVQDGVTVFGALGVGNLMETKPDTGRGAQDPKTSGGSVQCVLCGR